MSAPGGSTGAFCTQCGAAIPPNAVFCGSCGNPTGRSAGAEASAPPPTVPNPVAPPPTTPPSGPPPGPTGPPTGSGWSGPNAITPPAGTPYVTPPSAPIAGPPPAAASTSRGPLPGVLIGVGVVVVVLIIGIIVVMAVNGGSDDNADTTSETVPTSATVDAPALTPSAPVSVTLDPSTLDEPRVHPLTLRANQAGTVVVTSGQTFEPTVALVAPNGSEVPTEGVALADGGAAVTVQARGAGDYELLVSGFSPGQTSYDVAFRRRDVFVTPSQVSVGDCVDPLDTEQMESVSGFFVVGCAGAHRGQVFLRDAGATDTGQAAQERCDAARNQRVPLAGRVNWFAYWGDGLTCVVVSGDDSPLTGSIVAG